MNTDQARAAVVAAVRDVAPDVDPAGLGDATSLREDLGLDSLDLLSVVVALHDRCGVDVPEQDYGALATVGSAAAYLAAHAVAPAS